MNTVYWYKVQTNNKNLHNQVQPESLSNEGTASTVKSSITHDECQAESRYVWLKQELKSYVKGGHCHLDLMSENLKRENEHILYTICIVFRDAKAQATASHCRDVSQIPDDFKFFSFPLLIIILTLLQATYYHTLSPKWEVSSDPTLGSFQGKHIFWHSLLYVILSIPFRH